MQLSVVSTAVRFSYCKYKSYTCSDTVTEKVASGLCIFLQDISRMSAINLIKCDMVATIFWQCMQVEPHTKRVMIFCGLCGPPRLHIGRILKWKIETDEWLVDIENFLNLKIVGSLVEKCIISKKVISTHMNLFCPDSVVLVESGGCVAADI